MRRLVGALLFVSLLFVLLAACATSELQAPAPAPNGIELPADYASWQLLATSCRSDNGTLRAILGNDVAVEAVSLGETNPWPDGAILCKLVWKQAQLEEWPSAGVPGEFVHVEFMFKDSSSFASTGGWGFARWLGLELRPYGSDASFATECFSCHQPVAGNDYVFTRPARLP